MAVELARGGRGAPAVGDAASRAVPGAVSRRSQHDVRRVARREAVRDRPGALGESMICQGRVGSARGAKSVHFRYDPGGSRTRDLRIKSPLLYQLSYRVPIMRLPEDNSRAARDQGCAEAPHSGPHAAARSLGHWSARRPRIRALQRWNVDFLHLEHRLHDPVRLVTIRIAQHLAENRRVHLPGQSVLVLEPSARTFLAARGELLPELVDFLLRLAIDRERDGLVELELGTPVERDEGWPSSSNSTVMTLPAGPGPASP